MIVLHLLSTHRNHRYCNNKNIDFLIGSTMKRDCSRRNNQRKKTDKEEK
jgi:hypothetical protein